MNRMAINMSTKNLPVTDPYSGARIGTIYRHELFGVNRRAGGDDAWYRILFLNSKGALQWGVIRNTEVGVATNAYQSKFRYRRTTLDGRAQNVFKVRFRSLNLYSVTGRKIGSVSAGQEIAIESNSPLTGDNNPHWLRINYASKTSGGWDKITGDGAQYGYIDTGLAYGSRYNTIPCDALWSPHF